MTPTEAQIEAVEDVLRGLVVITGDSTWDMNYVARKVIDAAAGAGRGCKCLHVSRHGHQDDCELTTAEEEKQ